MSATILIVAKVVATAFAVIVVAGLAFAWLIHRANRIGGSDHDFGAKG